MKKEDLLLLKTLGIKTNSDLPINGEFGIINGYIIRKWSYYWAIDGKIPYKFAKEFEKQKDLEMRVCGSGYDVDHWCEHGFIKSKTEEYWETHTFKNYNENDFWKYIGYTEEEHFEKFKNEYYIPNYHIDTDEGLKLIIKTIKDNNLKAEW